MRVYKDSKVAWKVHWIHKKARQWLHRRLVEPLVCESARRIGGIATLFYLTTLGILQIRQSSLCQRSIFYRRLCLAANLELGSSLKGIIDA